MDAQHQPLRPETSRSHTWPSPSAPTLKITPVATQKPDLDLFDLDEHPEEHFLSPADMYDYDDDWSSDSDDDADDVEWNAGITDFALFDRDRQQAQAAGQAIPERWGKLLSNQASALDRAVERSRHDNLTRSPSTESMPDLTPDGSPQLCDDLEVGSYRPARPVIPAYLRTVASTSSIPTRQDDDEEGLSFYVRPRRTQSSPHITRRKPVRPGLRDGRTLSGKEHVWRRPSWDIFTVREDPAAEMKAETGSSSSQERDQAAVSDFQLALIR